MCLKCFTGKRLFEVMHTRKAVVRRLSFAHRETNSSFVEEKLAIPSFYVLNQEVIIILIFTDHTDDSPF